MFENFFSAMKHRALQRFTTLFLGMSMHIKRDMSRFRQVRLVS